MFLTIITFILVLSVLVFAHEFGHFMMARRFGVRSEEFGFGFPPRAFGFYKNDQGQWKFIWGAKEVKDCPGTIYSINWLPLGGFVKIKGENGEGQAEPDSFSSRPIWQRAFMLSAGVVMNIILAAVLITGGFMIGLPQALDSGLDARAHVSDKKIQIVQVMEKTPAEVAGLQIGDTILNINGNSFSSFESLQKFVADNVGNKLDYRIQRGQEFYDLMIMPEVLTETGLGGIGIGIIETGIVSYPWYLAIFEGIKTT
ncbi:MAG: site-2 protease family protein, partial [bacterium]|nr:site-2 protease family protein [bacterium]